jgi:glycine cleavage system H lipoate-binding protein
MIKVRVADPATALDGLMTADEYESFIAEEA